MDAAAARTLRLIIEEWAFTQHLDPGHPEVARAADEAIALRDQGLPLDAAVGHAEDRLRELVS